MESILLNRMKGHSLQPEIIKHDKSFSDESFHAAVAFEIGLLAEQRAY